MDLTRKNLPQNVMSAIQAVEKEYEAFKNEMLSKSKEEIFEGHEKIHFYSCIYDYFLHKEDIKEEYINACLRCDDIIGTLYAMYADSDYLSCGGDWEEVDGMLDDFQLMM